MRVGRLSFSQRNHRCHNGWKGLGIMIVLLSLWWLLSTSLMTDNLTVAVVQVQPDNINHTRNGATDDHSRQLPPQVITSGTRKSNNNIQNNNNNNNNNINNLERWNRLHSSRPPFWIASSQQVEIYETLLQKHSGIFTFTDRGRELVDAVIRELSKRRRRQVDGNNDLVVDDDDDVVTIMEVGVWLGSSVSRWLQLGPSVRVIAVDPFENPAKDHSKLLDNGVPEKLRSNFGKQQQQQQQTSIDTTTTTNNNKTRPPFFFNQGLAEYVIQRKVPDAANRTIIVQGYYPDAVSDFLFYHDNNSNDYSSSNNNNNNDNGKTPQSSSSSPQPPPPPPPQIDIFYLDGGKSDDVQGHMNFLLKSLLQIIQAFPQVIVAGDDWDHGDHSFEFQTVVIALAEGLNREVYVSKNWAWIMVPKTMDLNCTKRPKLAKLVTGPTVGKKKKKKKNLR